MCHGGAMAAAMLEPKNRAGHSVHRGTQIGLRSTVAQCPTMMGSWLSFRVLDKLMPIVTPPWHSSCNDRRLGQIEGLNVVLPAELRL